MLLLIGKLFIGLGLGFAAYFLTRLLGSSRKSDKWETPVERNSLVKMAHNMGSRLCGWLPFLDRRCRSSYDLKLKRGGLYPVFEGEAMLGFLILGLLGGIVITYLMYPANATAWILGAFGGLYYANYYFKKKQQDWQGELSRGFPYALDILTLSVEGGMDFSGALRELTHYLDPSPVKHECSMILSDMDMGVPRSEALKRFGARTTISEIKSVVMGVVQSIEMGSGMAETLKKQSTQLRFARLMKAEESAQKAPVKMMIPMVLFILPCVFVVIFAPLIISLIPVIRGFKTM